MSDLRGKKVVFTGQLVAGSRDEVEDAARVLGVDVDSAVSSNTDYLVCGADIAHNSKHTKILAAKEHNVAVLDEAGWNALTKG